MSIRERAMGRQERSAGWRVRRNAFAWVLAIVIGAVACGSDGTGPVDPKDDVVEIHMTSSFTFDPPQVVIKPGTKVRWINDANIFHTVTPQDTNQPGVWKKVETASSGPVFEFTFLVPNQTYVYRCEKHSTDFANGMVGRVIVQAQ